MLKNRLNSTVKLMNSTVGLMNSIKKCSKTHK